MIFTVDNEVLEIQCAYRYWMFFYLTCMVVEMDADGIGFLIKAYYIVATSKTL